MICLRAHTHDVGLPATCNFMKSTHRNTLLTSPGVTVGSEGIGKLEIGFYRLFRERTVTSKKILLTGCPDGRLQIIFEKPCTDSIFGSYNFGLDRFAKRLVLDDVPHGNCISSAPPHLAMEWSYAQTSRDRADTTFHECL